MSSRSLRFLIAHLVCVSGCAAVPSQPSGSHEGHGAAHPGSRTALQAPGTLVGQPLNRFVPYDDLADLDDDHFEFNMEVSERSIPLIDGGPTTMLVYNGQFPGPMITAKAGDRVTAHVKNTLNVPITVHFHGMVIEPEHDGGPWNTISPGQAHTYTWIAKKDYPMTGWYHAHPHGQTHVLTPRGMLGPLAVIDPNDPLTGPFGDDWLILGDQKFTADNQIPNDTEFDRFNGREGDHVFVNGQKEPVFRMRPNEVHRFRVLNGGPARYFNVAAPGFDMYQVGTDGGLIESPYKLDNIVLGVAERAEILLKAPMTPGTYKLKSLPYDRGLGLRENFSRDLMTIVVEDLPLLDQPAIPMTLRAPIQPIDLTNARERFFELGAESVGGGMKHFVINEKRFDPLRVDNVAKLGDTEIFNIDNKSGNWDHPMHLHSVQFQVLDVDGVAPPFRAWKDVVNLPRSSRARFAVRYAEDEFPGLFMFHCHILQHEDDGMMTHIMVNPAASPPPAP